MFLSQTIQLDAGETARRSQKDIVFGMGWAWVAGSLGRWVAGSLRGISRTLNITTTNPERFHTTFFVGYPEKMISKFSVEPFQKQEPEVLFPG